MSDLLDRRREEKDRRRNEILDAAALVVAEGGFDAVTMDQVARRARLSRALLYVYFEDKSDLYLALCVRAIEFLLLRFEAATADQPTGRARMAAMGRAYVTFSQELPVYFDALAHFEARDASALTQTQASGCVERSDQLHALMTAAIRDGVRDGSIRADIGNTDAVAIVLWGFMHGVIQIAATKGGLLEHRGTNAEQLYDQAVALALQALGPTP
jgi:TetR/AcrR family transcriptional regulator